MGMFITVSSVLWLIFKGKLDISCHIFSHLKFSSYSDFVSAFISFFSSFLYVLCFSETALIDVCIQDLGVLLGSTFLMSKALSSVAIVKCSFFNQWIIVN